MTQSLFIEGHLHSPYFIFVRAYGRYSDTDLLHLFGLADYHRNTSEGRPTRYAIIAHDGTWSMIADDWHYTLWHERSTRDTLEELGQSYDVFAASIGDSDHSFDFVYYCDGRLARRYVVDDTYCHGRQVMEDMGEPLPGEETAIKESDERDIVLGVAASLGIRAGISTRDIRVYVPDREEVRREIEKTLREAGRREP